MKASELAKELSILIAVHGDKDVAFDDGQALRPIGEADLVEEDDMIVFWKE